MGGSMQRRMARQRLKALAKYMQENEEADTVQQLIQRLGMKDMMLAQYEAKFIEMRTELGTYINVVLAARDLVENFREDRGLEDGLALGEGLEALDEAIKEFDKWHEEEEVTDAAGDSASNPDEIGEGEGKAPEADGDEDSSSPSGD